MDERTYSAAEHDAILTSTVERETAALREEVAELRQRAESAETRVDVLEAERAAVNARADAAEAEFAAFRERLEAEQAAAARQDERVGRVREVAKHLGDDFFTDARAQRWAAMEQAAFDEYLGDLATAAAKLGQSGPVPAETAMATARPASADPNQPSKTRRLLAARRVTTTTA